MAEGLPSSATADEVIAVIDYRYGVEMDAKRLDAMTLLGALRLTLSGGEPMESFAHLLTSEETHTVSHQQDDGSQITASIKVANKFQAIVKQFDDGKR